MSKYSGQARELMDAVVRTAEGDLKVRCWWCGLRPHNYKWEADHIFPLLKKSSPIAAACRGCNRNRQQRIPNGSQMRRLFHSPEVLRTVPSETLRELAKEAATSLFGGPHWIPLLIAAVDGKKPVYFAKNKIAVRETAKLVECIGPVKQVVPDAFALP